MKAVVTTAEAGFELVELGDPVPGPGELVLDVLACGICGSDVKMHSMMPEGTVLGHEFCGRVVGVGTGVRDSWREGQLVSALPLGTCGHCRWCLADDPLHCERVVLVGVGGAAGAFAELVRVDAGSAIALPESVGDLGALVEPLAVGLHAVAAGNVGPGDRVLVIGGGSVGSAVSVWARRLGAAEVVVSDPSAARREGSSAFGVTGVHDPSEGPAVSPGGAGYDVVIECVGAPGLLQAAADAAATRGRVVIAGVCIVPDSLVPVSALMKEIEIRFAVYYRRREFEAAAALVADPAFDASVFVADRVGLDGVNDAFTRLHAGTADSKILVTPTH